MTGRLICVVGPSGAGKDTLIDVARTQRPDLVIVRRVITRPSALGGEDFDGVTQAEFERRKAAGDFALDWRAHGLSYGLPAATLALRDEGHDLLVNGSRAALEQAGPARTPLSLSLSDAELQHARWLLAPRVARSTLAGAVPVS